MITLLEAAGLPTAGVPRTLGDFLVADTEDGLAGAIGLERYGSGALLRSAVVRPGDQGTGIGAALVRAVLDRARDGGLREIYLLTTTAERWFPRFGFAPIERDQVPDAVRGVGGVPRGLPRLGRRHADAASPLTPEALGRER